MNGSRARGRFERVERGPDRGVPDRVDLGRDPAGGGAVDEVAQRLGLGHPDAPATLGRERVVGLRFDVGEEGCRPRAERAVREALLPADPGTSVRVRTEDVAAAQPTRERRREGVIPDRGVDPDGQAARLRQAGIGRERGTPSSGSGETWPGSWTATTPSARSSPATARIAALEVLGAISGMWTVTRRAAASYRTPVRRAVGVAADDAAGGVRRVAGRCRPSRSAAWLPAARGGRAPRARRGDRAPRVSRSSAVGQRPHRSRVPAVTLQPRVGVGRRSVGRADPDEPLVERRARRSGRPGARRCAARRGGGARRSGPGSRPRRARGRSAP